MKKYVVVILFFLFFVKIYAQDKNQVFEEQYNKILENLNSENWGLANELSNSLLNNIENDESMKKEKSVLIYLMIYTNSGLLNENKISKDEALKRVEKFKGVYVSMPAHPIKQNCYINCTYLVKEEKNTLFSGVNNTAGTQIFSFEYVKMKEPIDEESIKPFEGKYVELYGKLKEITVEGNMLPRYRLRVEEGEMSIVE